jgi:hypothetical protein
MNKNAYKIFIFLFLLSFLLPSFSMGELGDTMFGFYCAIIVFAQFVEELVEGDFATATFNLFLNLPNLLVILSLFFHQRIPKWLKVIFAVLVFSSAIFWITEGPSSLLIGYWLWLLSCTGIMMMVIRKPSAKLRKKQA